MEHPAPYQLRVLNERADLAQKSINLDRFLRDPERTAGIPVQEISLLRMQQIVMDQYLAILDKRIENF